MCTYKLIMQQGAIDRSALLEDKITGHFAKGDIYQDIERMTHEKSQKNCVSKGTQI